MSDAPPIKLTRIRIVVLSLRLLRAVIWAVAGHCVFVVACWISGTSVKEVRRQIRLRELLGDR